MKEAEVEAHFMGFLSERGWDAMTGNADFTDVNARRGAELIAEVKGHTSSPGLDVDTLYGQILRRIRPDLGEQARFAVVVPRVDAGRGRARFLARAEATRHRRTPRLRPGRHPIA